MNPYEEIIKLIPDKKRDISNSFAAIIKMSLTNNHSEIILKHLKTIESRLNEVEVRNKQLESKLTGLNPLYYNSNLEKAIDILRLLGFCEDTFNGISPIFLNWMLENTITNEKYQPKKMTFEYLNVMQQAFFMKVAENLGEEPTYYEVKKLIKEWNE